jgi:hypothetical protein
VPLRRVSPSSSSLRGTWRSRREARTSTRSPRTRVGNKMHTGTEVRLSSIIQATLINSNQAGPTAGIVPTVSHLYSLKRGLVDLMGVHTGHILTVGPLRPRMKVDHIVDHNMVIHAPANEVIPRIILKNRQQMLFISAEVPQ